jgi:hypothetical protein
MGREAAFYAKSRYGADVYLCKTVYRRVYTVASGNNAGLGSFSAEGASPHAPGRMGDD